MSTRQHHLEAGVCKQYEEPTRPCAHGIFETFIRPKIKKHYRRQRRRFPAGDSIYWPVVTNSLHAFLEAKQGSTSTPNSSLVGESLSLHGGLKAVPDIRCQQSRGGHKRGACFFCLCREALDRRFDERRGYSTLDRQG